MKEVKKMKLKPADNLFPAGGLTPEKVAKMIIEDRQNLKLPDPWDPRFTQGFLEALAEPKK